MNQINDKCLDLMKSESASTKSEKKEKETKESESNCSFYNHQFQPNLRDHILVRCPVKTIPHITIVFH
jgi:hypothetical protein